jgi:protein disulfide-isomerase A6
MVLVKTFLLGALAATVAAKSAVLDLIPDNFDKVVLKSGKPTLVEFFAPWCGHCKTLAPVYEELASAFEHASDKVQIAKVDADAERSLGKRFGVQGFPTLKFFDGKSDKPVDYKSGRDLESLSAYITEKTGVQAKKKLALPSSVEWLNDANFNNAIGGDKHVLVAFTAPWCGHCKTLAPIWEEVATDFANDDNVLIAKVDADAANGKATAVVWPLQDPCSDLGRGRDRFRQR